MSTSPLPFHLEEMTPYLKAMTMRRPLTHCITNTVVQNFSANLLHAVQAVPAMNVMNEELETFIPICQAVMINFGTLSYELADNMIRAATLANAHHLPWVLDPVAIGPFLPYRTQLAQRMLALKPTVIRANPSEILALAGEDSDAKGPDGLNSSHDALPAAIQLAKTHQVIVAMTDEIDYITDGDITYQLTVGSPKLARITGAGCSLSALVAAMVGANSAEERLQSATAACFLMAYSGQLSDKASEGMGSFAVHLLDNLSRISDQVDEGEIAL